MIVAVSNHSPGFDRDIFTGNPSLEKLLETYEPKLTDEEKSFVNNQVDVLCSLLNDHEVTTAKDFSREAWVRSCVEQDGSFLHQPYIIF